MWQKRGDYTMRKKSNGMGSIYKEKNPNLKKPWVAKVSDGGKRLNLGYFETEAEAQEAINEFKRLKEEGISKSGSIFERTFGDVYNSMVKEYLKLNDPSRSRIMGFHSTEKHLTDTIKNTKMNRLNFETWQNFFTDLKGQGLGYSTIKRIRTDCSLAYTFAQNRGYNNVCYPKNVNIGKSPRKGQAKIFTHEEIWKLACFHNVGNDAAQFAVDTALVMIYSGVRISELLGIKNENIHFSESYFDITEAKTEAGVRQVPMHEAIKPIIQKYYDKNNVYLFSMPNKKRYTYANYRDSYWDRLRDRLNWDEDMTPHNCRKTCASLLKEFKCDMTYEKLILGHEGALDLTEKTYIHVEPKELVKAINQIPTPINLEVEFKLS